ncbi:hypothetical protein MERGE_002410 [Pneumocystis wakefieldiae]|uniref:BCD1 alpha/beta domain-containing protein n=1 Tax=Pneumocystis wakefieldiae TaxID=38082 RepID=A0A899FXT4_9ASCO|nr:hypothetical protein MERGE_002410 [Pneumocystis wakefieldiae]
MNCSRRHKSLNSCSGAFSPASFLSKKELLTVQSLDRDYNFLSSVESCLDRCARNRAKIPSKNHALRLKKTIEKNGIHYSVFPREMSRAAQNRTFWDQKKKKLFWTIEWVYTKNGSKISGIEHKVPSEEDVVKAYKNFIHKRNIQELLDIDDQRVEFMMKKAGSTVIVFLLVDTNNHYRQIAQFLKQLTKISLYWKALKE